MAGPDCWVVSVKKLCTCRCRRPLALVWPCCDLHCSLVGSLQVLYRIRLVWLIWRSGTHKVILHGRHPKVQYQSRPESALEWLVASYKTQPRSSRAGKQFYHASHIPCMASWSCGPGPDAVVGADEVVARIDSIVAVGPAADELAVDKSRAPVATAMMSAEWVCE